MKRAASAAVRRPPDRRIAGADRGSVTAEMAMVLPSVLLVLGMLLWGLGAASAQLRCIDAAREVARAVARGDDLLAARQAAAPVAPPGATIRTWRTQGLVHVQVDARVTALGPVGHLVGGINVTGHAAAAPEPQP